MDLLKEFGKGESNEALKINTELLKLNADFHKKKSDQNKKNAADELTKLKEDAQILQDEKKIKFLEDQVAINEIDTQSVNERFLRTLELERVFQEQVSQLKISAAHRQLELLTEQGLQETAVFRQIQMEKLQAEKELSEQRIQTAQKESEAKKAIHNKALDVFGDVVDATIGLLSRDEKARKKNFALLKAIEAAKVTINLAAELSEIFKTYATLGPFGQLLAIFQAAASTARAFTAISKIKGASFYDGGPTGNKVLYRDADGHDVVGAVHKDEYVVPKAELARPDVATRVNYIDRIRRKRLGFVDGGFTSVDTTPSGISDTNSNTQGPGNGDAQETLQLLREIKQVLLQRSNELRATVLLDDLEGVAQLRDQIQARADI